MKFALTHFHYDRFDTADDEEDGKWSVNFQTSPQGDVDKALMSLDESEASFVRRAPSLDAALAQKLVGTYETATGYKVQVQFKEGAGLAIVAPGQPQTKLMPYKGLKFRSPDFSDLIFEFVMENGQVKSLKQTDPSGESSLTRK
ncbi:MAG: hypothetical protein HY014_18395 [Acidobacteria bacterium]|nr:hypothetical protein [Acidobacteriota bacterium]MBI3490109.1 hypothetical protein [Acidobacteriota bacterium]